MLDKQNLYSKPPFTSDIMALEMLRIQWIKLQLKQTVKDPIHEESFLFMALRRTMTEYRQSTDREGQSTDVYWNWADLHKAKNKYLKGALCITISIRRVRQWEKEMEK